MSRSHASATGSNNSEAAGQPREPSEGLRRFVNQPSTEDSVVYGRALDQPEEGNLDSRATFYEDRAQKAITELSAQLGENSNDTQA
ncbi:hypothetical protein VTJ04DRAFT_9346 [Mycothermus thermophilus]|uniref:uncharacterized protein n=1 Tax=Humicola insolens TaxID=85995 RepID=UPI003742BF7E